MLKLSNSVPEIKVQKHGSVSRSRCLRFLWSTRLLYKLVVLLIGNFLLITISYLIFRCYLNRQTNTFTKTCYKRNDDLQQLDHLAQHVHNVLNTMNLTHFLCYDSLWGEMHYKSNFPWADKVQLCAIYEEIYKADSFEDEFQEQGLDVSYNWLEGLYKVTDPLFSGGQVQVILFKTESEVQWLRRIGLKHFRYRPDCRDVSLQCFHSYLLEAPLRLVEFGSGRLPVPRHGIAIQKYHYTDSSRYNDKYHNKPPLNC